MHVSTFQYNGVVRICHSIREIATQPVILWIELGGKPKWLPLNFGFNDVMRTAPLYQIQHYTDEIHEVETVRLPVISSRYILPGAYLALCACCSRPPPPPPSRREKVGRSGSRSVKRKCDRQRENAFWQLGAADAHRLLAIWNLCLAKVSANFHTCKKWVRRRIDASPLFATTDGIPPGSETAVIFKPGRSLKLHVHINNHDRLSDATHNRLDGSLRRRADSELSSLSANTYGHVPTGFFFSHTPTVGPKNPLHAWRDERETRIHDVSGVQPQNSQKAQPSHSYNKPPKRTLRSALSRRFSTANRKCCTQHCSRHDHEVTWTENISWSCRRAECSASTKAIMLAWWIRNSASER